MDTQPPSLRKIFLALLRADFKTQWRNRRASLMSLIVPVIILVSWSDVVAQFGAAFALASCMTLGLVAVGLMGYSNTLANDRDKGIFQRLRVTPAPTSAIMLSRIVVQLAQMAIMTVVVLLVGYLLYQTTFTPGEYILTVFASLLCGAVYLGLGQAVVGLISSAETVSATTRLIYFPFILIGALGEIGILGKAVATFVKWSPYGVVKLVLFATLEPSVWNGDAWLALLLALGYALIFAAIGIRWFTWTSR